jgi:hypothetical protein
MKFELSFTRIAAEALDALEKDKSQGAELKAVRKCLGFLETNPRHRSLNSKPYHSLCGPSGEKVFESYAENWTPGAYRVFWYYGSTRGKITISSIVRHP